MSIMAKLRHMEKNNGYCASMSSTLVQKLTFKDGAEYRGMFQTDSLTMKTKYETANKRKLLLLLFYYYC